MKCLVGAGVFLALACAGLAAQTSPAGYRPVGADEFAVDGQPDPKNWTNEVGFVRNQELQWYQAANATSKGGRLIIEGRRERKPKSRSAAQYD